MENKRWHLEAIQSIINRMAGNSFALKGWAVTLVAGIFALIAKESSWLLLLIPYMPILMFWGLDSYYLLQERLYRALYEKVRRQKEEQIDFSMKASSKEFTNSTCKWRSCFFSKTEFWFYLPLALVATIFMIAFK